MKKIIYIIFPILIFANVNIYGKNAEELTKKLNDLEKQASMLQNQVENTKKTDEYSDEGVKAGVKDNKNKVTKEVQYYYLPPEIKVTPEERARVIGKARKKLNDKKLEEQIIKGKVTKEEAEDQKNAKLEEKIAENNKKTEEEFKKNLAQYEKEKKIKSVERTLGINSNDEYSGDYDGLSDEVVDILKKQKELEAMYNKVQ
ncbi:MAG: hypothetical protein LBT51_07210 [Fusobacteriaceae bacterium]|nr:hypothetical protein [Fusobacteriaceae bacterium]